MQNSTCALKNYDRKINIFYVLFSDDDFSGSEKEIDEKPVEVIFKKIRIVYIILTRFAQYSKFTYGFKINFEAAIYFISYI